MYEDIIVNKYQTPVTEKLLEPLNDKYKQEFLEVITTVPYIRNLISPKRRYAKDMPKDKDGKIIPDFENPHILENTQFFTKTVDLFKENDCYILLRPNSNPNSEYSKFWKEERRRCREGYIRDDGEWISGYMYWYMNFCPMLINVSEDEDSISSNRIEGFPLFWESIYLRFHIIDMARKIGKHFIEFARRGSSKSYSLGSIASHNLILGENSISYRNVKTFVVADTNEYLSVNSDGTMNKFYNSLNFIFNNTEFPNLLLTDSPAKGKWQMGWRDDYNRVKGSQNLVSAIATEGDPDKLRGKRGIILFEEMGNFSKLKEIYNTGRHSVEEGNKVFGQMLLVGTSNEKESNFQSAKQLLYNPDAYNLFSINNVYDKPKQGRDKFGYFLGGYMNRSGCYNKDGVSNVTKALVEIFIRRQKADESNDQNTILNTIAEDPITPAEAINKTKATYFPTIQCQDRITQLDNDISILNNVSVGKLVLQSNNTVKFIPTNDKPLRSYKDDTNMEGALEIYEMPEKQSDGTPYFDRYCIGYDPVDNDVAVSSSLASAIVLDLYTDRIVAEWTGRYNRNEENNEIVRLLCLFYGCQVLAESNKKSWYAYFASMNNTNLLAITPEYLREKELVKYSAFGSSKYGVNANATINNYGFDLIRQWLTKPLVVTNGDGENAIETTIYNLYTIKNRALLEELVAFNPEHGNYDRIHALKMCMLYREGKMIQYKGDIKRENKTTSDFYSSSSFFTENYDDLLNISK